MTSEMKQLNTKLKKMCDNKKWMMRINGAFYSLMI